MQRQAPTLICRSCSPIHNRAFDVHALLVPSAECVDSPTMADNRTLPNQPAAATPPRRRATRVQEGNSFRYFECEMQIRARSFRNRNYVKSADAGRCAARECDRCRYVALLLLLPGSGGLVRFVAPTLFSRLFNKFCNKMDTMRAVCRRRASDSCSGCIFGYGLLGFCIVYVRF